jgi:xylulokinase
VELIEAEEGAAYGGALLAGVGVGVWPSVDTACDIAVRVAKRVEPDPERMRRMEQQYAAYRRVYPALRDIYREVN